jgi:hypothetical protein
MGATLKIVQRVPMGAPAAGMYLGTVLVRSEYILHRDKAGVM